MGRKVRTGTLIRDDGVGTLVLCLDGTDGTDGTEWLAPKTRCARLKAAAVPADTPRHSLVVPAEDARRVAAWLAMPRVRQYPDAAPLQDFVLPLADGSVIVAVVTNGSRATRAERAFRPYVAMYVLPPSDGDPGLQLPSYEHPPLAKVFLGEHAIVVANRPALLEIAIG